MLNLGLVIFVIVLLIIVLILFFISLTRLGQSGASILDEADADDAFFQGSIAVILTIVAFGLAIINGVLYYYQVDQGTLAKVISFSVIIFSLLAALFAYRSYLAILRIDNPDQIVQSSSPPMIAAAILLILTSFVEIFSFAYLFT